MRSREIAEAALKESNADLAQALRRALDLEEENKGLRTQREEQGKTADAQRSVFHPLPE